MTDENEVETDDDFRARITERVDSLDPDAHHNSIDDTHREAVRVFAGADLDLLGAIHGLFRKGASAEATERAMALRFSVESGDPVYKE